MHIPQMSNIRSKRIPSRPAPAEDNDGPSFHGDVEWVMKEDAEI